MTQALQPVNAKPRFKPSLFESMAELVQELPEAHTKIRLKVQRFYIGKCLWRKGEKVRKGWERCQTTIQVTHYRSREERKWVTWK